MTKIYIQDIEFNNSQCVKFKGGVKWAGALINLGFDFHRGFP